MHILPGSLPLFRHLLTALAMRGMAPGRAGDRMGVHGRWKRPWEFSYILHQPCSATHTSGLVTAEWLWGNRGDVFFLAVNPSRELTPGDRWQRPAQHRQNRARE